MAHPLRTLVCKLASPGGAATVHGHETRRKKPVRGFYTDPAPGFYDVRGKFEDAKRTNPEVKLAQALAARTVLDVFGFHGVKQAAEKAPDPLQALIDVFHKYDFGLNEEGKFKSRMKSKTCDGGRGSEVEADTPVGLEW